MLRYLIMTGGLGNQMFQYALILSLRNKGFNIVIDKSYYEFFEMHNGFELERVFNIKENAVSKLGFHINWLRFLNKYRPQILCSIDKLTFDYKILTSPHKYLIGYWQNENYFIEIEEEIRRVYKFNNIDSYNRLLDKEMQECNSVSLHIRRGDYLDFGVSILNKEYYKNAVEIIKKRISTPFFYIFSDDKVESEKIAKGLDIEYKIIQHNVGEGSYKDMYLMSKCSHNILANSSFSWWGAWLNENANKIVIAPKIWDKKHLEFFPQIKNWILL